MQAPASVSSETDELRHRIAELEAELATRTSAMREQEAALRNIISHIPYAVFWKDREGKYIGVNQYFADFVRVKPEAFPGTDDLHPQFPWTRAEAEFYRKCDREVMESGKALLNIEEQLSADNDHTIMTSKVPLRDDAGQVIGMLGIFTDITERKRIERELERANQAKSEFLAVMSHELRTPLALVMGPIEAALEGSMSAELSPVLRESLERVRRNAHRLKSLVDDVLDYSKAEAGKIDVLLEPMLVGDHVATVVDDALPAASARDITLEVNVEDGRGESLADPKLLDRIVLNLVGNALKFTPRGGKVSVSLRHDDHAYELAVRDSGCGIPKDKLPLLFQRFQQVDASWKRRHEGTGLGLAIVRQFAELMGGSVAVASDEGIGSCFTVRLPLAAANAGSVRSLTRPRMQRLLDMPAPEKMPRAQPPSTGSDAQRPRIVIAEDNADMRAYLEELLAERYEVCACENGQRALDELRRRPADLVISDVMMPELNGHELTAALRADAALTHTPVILLTAKASREALVSSLDGGADDYLAKPFFAAELHARVGVALRLHRAREALALKNRELVATHERLMEAEKLSALGRLLVQLSHEINNPMNVIQNNLAPMSEYLVDLERVLDRLRPPAGSSEAAWEDAVRGIDLAFIRTDFRAALGDVAAAARRVQGIQQDLRIYLQHGRPAPRAVGDLSVTLRDAVELFRRGMPASVEIVESYGAIPAVAFNDGQMTQVFANLLQNAADAIGRAGTIWIRTERRNASVRVEIADSGPGVPAEIRQRIFEPFFTTKEVGRGTGLGLAVSRQIVRDGHGGQLALGAVHGRGATFLIDLPFANEAEGRTP